jgi:hypothetical protein
VGFDPSQTLDASPPIPARALLPNPVVLLPRPAVTPPPPALLLLPSPVSVFVTGRGLPQVELRRRASCSSAPPHSRRARAAACGRRWRGGERRRGSCRGWSSGGRAGCSSAAALTSRWVMPALGSRSMIPEARWRKARRARGEPGEVGGSSMTRYQHRHGSSSPATPTASCISFSSASNKPTAQPRVRAWRGCVRQLLQLQVEMKKKDVQVGIRLDSCIHKFVLSFYLFSTRFLKGIGKQDHGYQRGRYLRPAMRRSILFKEVSQRLVTRDACMC